MENRLAIFDLDGTLTTRDSFLAFLLTFGRRHRRYASLARTPFRLAAYLSKLTVDYRLKQALISDFLSSADEEIVADHSRWFCQAWLPRYLHPVGIELLNAHKQRGDRIILLSASPDVFVPHIAGVLEIGEVVCTRVKRTNGRWTGPIIGKNCKGAEKVRAVQEYTNDRNSPANSFAYGDSNSDLDILQWVRFGAWVRRNNFEPLQPVDRDFFPSVG